MESTRGMSKWLPKIGSLAILVGIVVTAIIASGGRNDIDIFLAASNDFLDGINMYGKKYIDGFSYFYSPFFTLLISPLTALDAATVKLIWGGLMLISLWRCWKITDLTLLIGVGKEKKQLILFLTMAAMFQAARDNLNAGQVTFFLIWLCFEGLYRIWKRQWAIAAILLAIGIDMKFIPLVLVPYLIYRKQWKPALLTVVFVAVLQLLPALVVSWEAEVDLLKARWAMVDPNEARHILDEEEPSTISLGSLISAYLSKEGGNPHTLAMPRTIASLSLESIKLILLFGRSLIVLLALWFLEWPPFSRARNMQHSWWEVSYLLLCTVLLFPHQRNYSLMLAAPAVVWMVWYVVAGPGSSTSHSWLWWTPRLALLVSLNADFLVGEFAPIFNHYKFFSFVAIGLILLLMANRPKTALAAPSSEG